MVRFYVFGSDLVKWNPVKLNLGPDWRAGVVAVYPDTETLELMVRPTETMVLEAMGRRESRLLRWPQ